MTPSDNRDSNGEETFGRADGIRRRPRRDPLSQNQETDSSKPQSAPSKEQTPGATPENAIESESESESECESETKSSPSPSPSPSPEEPKQHYKASLPVICLHGIVHLGCIALYLIPILTPNEFSGPTLDETHIMSVDVQKDIHDPNATLEQIFSNDYWGRPMNSPSSHKSWRPLTILSFRYLKGPYVNAATHGLQQLTVHRFVNAVCHAAAGEVVGQLATQLFALHPNESALWLHLITKVLFCLHPTHVEVTANAANRNHVLAVLLSVKLCFLGSESVTNRNGHRGKPHRLTTPLFFFGVALVAGYLASETFVFMVPGVMVTMTVVAFTHQPQNERRGMRQFVLDYLLAVLSIAPRLILLVASVAIYIGGRWYFDTLDIPILLIRPAESPFYAFEGTKRVQNYLYIVTVHLGKQWGSFLPKTFGGDPIGFSHEYGYDCIPEIKAWGDGRLIFGVGFHLVFAMVLSVVLIVNNPRRFFGLVAMHWSWTLGTLFPICGILKVGTFVSDRIVVPSTVVVSLWTGRIVQKYVTEWFWKKNSLFGYFRPLQFAFFLWWIVVSYATVHNRALEWMSPVSLLKSALVTCPRFAKAHNEMSKIYSGLYPSLLNLKTTRYHLDVAREIDPDLCDVHMQYVFMAIQENNYMEIEREITGALLCKFTSTGAEKIWNNYWNQLLSSVPPGTPQHADFERRYREAYTIVHEGVRMELAEDAAKVTDASQTT